jgi:hypothetical protein
VNNIEKAIDLCVNVSILGDFNIDITDVNHQYYNKFTLLCQLFNFDQLINEPTRVTPTSSTIIDLICTNIPDRHALTNVLKVTLSDHFLISTHVSSPVREKHKTINCRTYKNFNSNSFTLDLSAALDNFSLNDSTPVLKQWDRFKSLFLGISDYHAPYRSYRAKAKSSPWVNDEIVKLIKIRDKTHSEAISNSDSILFEEYRSMRNNINGMIAHNKKSFITDIVTTDRNSKSLWKAVSYLTGKNEQTDSIPNELNADVMNQFFANVGSRLTGQFDDGEPVWKGPSSSYTFSFQLINEQTVKKYLRNLPDKSNLDILCFDAKLLRVSSEIIAKPLTNLFNLSITQCYVPDDWKKARVTPIYKGKGSHSDSSNYRPISVICHIAKIFEKCVQYQLMYYLEDHCFITCDQSAFLKNNSTVTAVHKAVDNWLNNIDDGLITVVCFFDIAKCFDSISHSVLLFKLEKYGIRDNELKWFTSYLSNRSQATLAHSSLSSFLPVKTGVPQGSILGPLLFLLFINDLPKFVQSAYLYADDSLIDRSGTSLDEIIPLMQSDINSLCDWFSSNKLTLSIHKCCSMIIGSSQRIKQYETFTSLGLYINDTPIAYCLSYKYLGLEIDNTLSWRNAILNVCKLLRSKLAAVQRLCKFIPLEKGNILYYAHIQSHIDYCLTVWGHTTDENISNIQRFQNRAARIISQNFNYHNVNGFSLVLTMGWLTLEERRDYLTLITVYKSLNNIGPYFLSDMFTYISDIHSRPTRQSEHGDLYIPQVRTNYMKRSLQFNGPSLWNKLPLHIRNANSLNSFKWSCKGWIISLRTMEE